MNYSDIMSKHKKCFSTFCLCFFLFKLIRSRLWVWVSVGCGCGWRQYLHPHSPTPPTPTPTPFSHRFNAVKLLRILIVASCRGISKPGIIV